MTLPRIETLATPALQAFADHLTACTSGCALELDGSGPLCETGEPLSAIDWEAELTAQTRAADAARRADVITAAVAGARAGRRHAEIRRDATAGSCPMGGDHSPGSSGEWIGRCTKCDQSC